MFLSRVPVRRIAGALIVLLVSLVHTPRIALAQFAVGGVYIDAEGMLRQTSELSEDDRLQMLRDDLAAGGSSSDVARQSVLRKVSLSRLERELARLAAEGNPPTADLRNLAGLQRIQYVLFDPEQRDVILAGPAESWRQWAGGGVVGAASGLPVLQLDDLIVALRYAFATGVKAPFVGCSIDPTVEGAQRYAAYMNSLGAWDRSRLPQILASMPVAMGPQSVRVFGVPGSSRFAMKLVAADYRLKRIALGHDPSPVKDVVNYLDLTAKNLRPGPQKQHRWWFVGEFDAIYHTSDELAYELAGQGVKVSTAPTVSAKGEDLTTGNKATAPQASPAALQFATSMTRHFEGLARHIPVFGELRNLIALTLATELIAEKCRQPGATSWRPVQLLADDVYAPEATAVPSQTESIVNYRLVDNRHWLFSISGGVEISPPQLLDRKKRQLAPPRQKLDEAARRLHSAENQPHWWWD